MADRRELILERLLAIGEALYPARAFRNKIIASSGSDPLFCLIDGGEVTEEEKSERPRRGQVFSHLECAVMAPQLQVLMRKKVEEIGSALNVERIRVYNAVMNDPQLAAICGASYGLIRYTGCAVDTESGEASEGRIDLNFSINYPVVGSELSAP